MAPRGQPLAERRAYLARGPVDADPRCRRERHGRRKRDPRVLKRSRGLTSRARDESERDQGKRCFDAHGSLRQQVTQGGTEVAPYTFPGPVLEEIQSGDAGCQTMRARSTSAVLSWPQYRSFSSMTHAGAPKAPAFAALSVPSTRAFFTSGDWA